VALEERPVENSTAGDFPGALRAPERHAGEELAKQYGVHISRLATCFGACQQSILSA